MYAHERYIDTQYFFGINDLLSYQLIDEYILRLKLICESVQQSGKVSLCKSQPLYQPSLISIRCLLNGILNALKSMVR